MAGQRAQAGGDLRACPAGAVATCVQDVPFQFSAVATGKLEVAELPAPTAHACPDPPGYHMPEQADTLLARLNSGWPAGGADGAVATSPLRSNARADVSSQTGRQVPAEPMAVASAQGKALGVVTLAAWLLTEGLGAFMLGTLVSRGSLSRQRAVRDGLSPAVLFGHFGLAGTGLLTWVSYLATGWAALAWFAVGLLMPAIGLGICTLTLWTPYPHRRVAASAGPRADQGGAGTAGGVAGAPTGEPLASHVTDDTFARALTDDMLAGKLVDEVIAGLPAYSSRSARKLSEHLAAAVIPVGHGMAAVATFAFAVVTAAGTR